MITIDPTLRGYYSDYFARFHEKAVGKFAPLTYGSKKPNDTASSLESIIAYWDYIRTQRGGKRVISILNAGAGASSWMFRTLVRSTHDFIHCCDPDPNYLALVESVCESENLCRPRPSEEEYWTGGEFILGFPKFSYDHVYYDYGQIERLPFLGMAIAAAEKSVYVDDVDKRHGAYAYREITIKLCDAMGLRWFDCDDAKDASGRSGIIIEKS